MANRYPQRGWAQGSGRGGQERGGGNYGGNEDREDGRYDAGGFQSRDQSGGGYRDYDQSGRESQYGQSGGQRWGSGMDEGYGDYTEGFQGQYGQGGAQGNRGNFDPAGAAGMGPERGSSNQGWGGGSSDRQNWGGRAGGGGAQMAQRGNYQGGGMGGGYRSQQQGGGGYGNVGGGGYSGGGGGYGSGSGDRGYGGNYGENMGNYGGNFGSYGGQDVGGFRESDYGSRSTLNQSQGRGRGAAAGRRGPKGWQRSDERIKEDVSERLYHDQQTDSSEVTVEVAQGKVTLEGTVSDRYMKYAIEDLVDQCPGVKDIDNRIRVGRNEGTEGQDSTSSSSTSQGTSQYGSSQRSRKD